MYNNNKNSGDKEMLIKHSGAINISNNLNAMQRKGWNALLYRAFPNLTSLREHECPLSDIRNDCGYKNRNLNDFKQLIRGLQGVVVDGDLFNKADEDWRSTQLLGDVAFTREGMIRWSYSESLSRLLANPKVYARLNMTIQKGLNGKFALPLWECFVDQLGSRRASATVKLTIELAREILPVDKGQYTQFKDFKRYVIEKAVDEINCSSDIQVKEVHYKRVGRRVGEIHFDVVRRKTERLTAIAASEGERVPIVNRLENEFGFNKKQIENVIATTKAEHPGDFETYLIRAMDYVHVKSAAGEIKSTVGAYLTGVLKNGFNTGGEIDKPKQQKEEAAEKSRAMTSAFHMHRLKRMLEIFDSLSNEQIDELKDDFKQQCSASDRIAIDANGLDTGDAQLINSFNSFLLGVLLTEPEDTDIDVYSRNLN